MKRGAPDNQKLDPILKTLEELRAAESKKDDEVLLTYWRFREG